MPFEHLTKGLTVMTSKGSQPFDLFKLIMVLFPFTEKNFCNVETWTFWGRSLWKWCILWPTYYKGKVYNATSVWLIVGLSSVCACVHNVHLSRSYKVFEWIISMFAISTEAISGLTTLHSWLQFEDFFLCNLNFIIDFDALKILIWNVPSS